MTSLVCGITGANGFLGGALCRAYEAAGWRVIELVRSPRETPRETRRFVLGAETPPKLLIDIDVLVHAAYDFSACSWADIRRINVLGTEKLFDAATRAGVQRQIFISSMAAFEGCRSKYGLAKLASEEAARIRGGSVIRPGVIYSEQNGGIAAKIAKVASTLPIVPMIGSGRYPLYTCHVDDLCRLIIGLTQSTTRPDTPILAAHPEPITLRALAVAARRPGRFQAILPVPWRMVFTALWGAEHFGLRPGFRSDSVVSLVHANPRVELLADRHRQIDFRPFPAV